MLQIGKRSLARLARGLHGQSIVAGAPVAARTDGAPSSFAVTGRKGGAELPGRFTLATAEDLATAAAAAHEAFKVTRSMPSTEMEGFLRLAADEIDALGEDFVDRVVEETGYPDVRVRGERDRTTGQLRAFAALVAEGSWVEARLDVSGERDLRRLRIPLGPVAVFGASNFPLAFSVAGGDTASAFAARCPVIVKAHPAHPGTSEIVGEAIARAVAAAGLPPGFFSMLHGDVELGQQLVADPRVAAVGFTGSTRAGRALMDTCAARPTPIPVYAEMGSINPVFVLPSALETRWQEIAGGLSGSLTLGTGQFCTNPGIAFVAGDASAAQKFVEELGRSVAQVPPGTMLTPGIMQAYQESVATCAATPGVEMVTPVRFGDERWTEAAGVVFTTTLENFLAHREVLSEEMFGPAQLVVTCRDAHDMVAAAENLEGQLVGSVHGNASELAAPEWAHLVDTVAHTAGRLVFNGYPTGVEVCAAMHHGGPYPSSSNPLYTSVGTEAIQRFSRPVCFQDFPEDALTPELRAANPHGIMRVVNNEHTRAEVPAHSRKP